MDCMEYMKRIPDKFFDLAVVDPPYGIGITKSGRLKKYNANQNQWDRAVPDQTYFDELFRVSKNQIIWGGELLQPSTYKMFSDLGQTTTGKCVLRFLRIGMDELRSVGQDVLLASSKA